MLIFNDEINNFLRKKDYVNIEVKPNSKEEKIILRDNKLIINLKKPAVDNKANNELIKLFKKNNYLITIKSGLKSRSKLIKLIR